MTLDRDLQIKRLLADLDAALAASSDGAEEVRSPRALVEQVRAYLADVAEQPASTTLGNESSWVEQSWDALSPDLQANAPDSSSATVRELTQAALQSIQQDIDRLRQETIAPMQLDLEALRHQRQSLSEEITQLENQRQYYQSLAQQQANQEQLIGDFLQQLRDRLQTSISEQVSQLVARSPESAPDPSDLVNLEASASGVLDRLQTTLGAIVTALQTNSQRYEEALNAALERMHVLGEESEAVLDHWLSRLASTLGRDLPGEPTTTLPDEGSSLGGGGFARPSLTATSLAMPPLPPPAPGDEVAIEQPAAELSLTDLTYDDQPASPDEFGMAALATADEAALAGAGAEAADSEVDFAALDRSDLASTDTDLWELDEASSDLPSSAESPASDQDLASFTDASALPPLPEFPLAGAIAPDDATEDITAIETSEPTLIGGIEDEIFGDVDAIFQLPEEPPVADDSPSDELPVAGDWDPLAVVATGTIATGAIAAAFAGSDEAEPMAAEALPLSMDVGVAAPDLDYDAEPNWDAAPPLPAGQSIDDMTDGTDDTNLDLPWEAPLPTDGAELAAAAPELQPIESGLDLTGLDAADDEPTTISFVMPSAATPSDDLLTDWGGGGMPALADFPSGLDDEAALTEGGDRPASEDADIDFEALETSQSQLASPDLDPGIDGEAAALPNFDDWSIGADADLEGVDLTGDPASDLAEEWDQIAIEPPESPDPAADPAAIAFDDALPPMAAELASESEDLGGDLRAELSAWQQPGIADEADAALTGDSADDFLTELDEAAPIELEPDVMSEFDPPLDPATVAEPNSMFEGSWSDAAESAEANATDDQLMGLLPDLGAPALLEDPASTDLGAIELDVATEPLGDADDLSPLAELTAEDTTEATLPPIDLPDWEAAVDDDGLSLDVTDDVPDSSTDFGDDLLPGLDLPDDGSLEDASEATAGLDLGSAGLWEAAIEAGDEREAGLEAIAGLRDDPTFGDISQAGGVDEAPPMEVDWEAALAAPADEPESLPDLDANLDLGLEEPAAEPLADVMADGPDAGLDQDLGWDTPDSALDAGLGLDLDGSEPGGDFGSGFGAADDLGGDLGAALEPDLGLGLDRADEPELDLGWSGGGGEPVAELELGDPLEDAPDSDQEASAALDLPGLDWPAEDATAGSDDALGEDLFSEGLGATDFETELGAAFAPDADPAAELELPVATDELPESLDDLSGLDLGGLDLDGAIDTASPVVEAAGDWPDPLMDASPLEDGLPDAFGADVEAAPEAIGGWETDLGELPAGADDFDAELGNWGDMGLGDVSDDSPAVSDLGGDDSGDLGDLDDLGNLGGAIEQELGTGWDATTELPSDPADDREGIDNLDFGLISLDLEDKGDGLLGLEDNSDLTLTDLTANPLEIQSLDLALETGMAAFGDPLASMGTLDADGDGLGLLDLDSASLDPTNLESTLMDFEESAELSPLGELDSDLDALLSESLLSDSDLDETKKE